MRWRTFLAFNVNVLNQRVLGAPCSRSELYFISVDHRHLQYLGSDKNNKFYHFSSEKDFRIPVRESLFAPLAHQRTCKKAIWWVLALRIWSSTPRSQVTCNGYGYTEHGTCSVLSPNFLSASYTWRYEGKLLYFLTRTSSKYNVDNGN